LSGFPSRLWMKISSPSRNTSARKPSHLGSKIQSPSAGNSSTRFASIGRIGGFSRRSTPHGITWLHLLIAPENEPLSDESRLPSPFRRQPKSVRTPQQHSLHGLTGSLRFYLFRQAPTTLSRSRLLGKHASGLSNFGGYGTVPRADLRARLRRIVLAQPPEEFLKNAIFCNSIGGAPANSPEDLPAQG